jgi:hypothetical protein
VRKYSLFLSGVGRLCLLFARWQDNRNAVLGCSDYLFPTLDGWQRFLLKGWLDTSTL